MVDLTVETVFPDGPSSNPAQPNKATIRRYFKQFESAVDAGLSNGGLIYDTKDNMDADLAHDANASAWVIGDSSVANNGIYRKTGASGSGSWTRVGDLPYSFIRASNAGAGTANAIQATTSIPVPASDGAALITLNIVENNTGAATVSFNGGSALAIKTANGNDVQADYLVEGAVVSGFVVGGLFWLNSEVGTAADKAAAEAAADAAVAAAETVSVKYAADDAAMKALTGENDRLIFNLATKSWWLPTSDDISAQITASDPRYRPTLDDPTGVAGGYYRVGSIASGQIYENLGARIERIADRVMIGGEAVKFNGLADGAGGKGGFLWDLLPGASASHAWMEQQAILSVGGLYDANGGIAINGYLAGPGIAINAHILHDRSANPLAASGAWAFYGDARRDLPFATTWVAEYDIINGLPSPHTAFGPWGGNGSTADGRTVALHLGSGGGASINGTTYTADVALLIQKNSSTFYAGIAFGGQSLEPDSGTGRMHAIGMSPKQAIDWWGNNVTAGILASLVSNVTDTSVPQELAFQNLGLDYSSGGKTLFHVAAPANAATYIVVTPTITGGAPSLAAAGAASAISLSLRSKGATATTFLQNDATPTFSATGVASAVNRLDALAAATGAAVQLRAQGTDADIDIQLTPKGTGNVRFGTHAALAAETVTGYIAVKDAGGTTRKLAVVS